MKNKGNYEINKKTDEDVYAGTLYSLRQVTNLKTDILTCINHGTIDYADAASQLLMLNKKEYQLKEKLINEVHVTKDGTPRKIEYKETKDLWCTIMPDKSKLYGKTKEILLDKLMARYGIFITDMKFATVFNRAGEYKDRTESVKEATLLHLRFSFNRFISKELADTDIRKITFDMLAEYTLKMLRDAQTVDDNGVTRKIKKKAFLEYKSVLNLTFEYALYKDFITANPVVKLKNKVYFKECDCSKPVSDDKIFSDAEIASIKDMVRSRMEQDRYDGYFVNGYAILFAIETGVRCGEIPSLKWSDIHSNYIHIHTQQLSNRRDGYIEYYYADYTKDEKGESRGGRKFPLTREIRKILSEIREVQERKEIISDYVFCEENGEWITKDSYIKCLRRLLKGMGFEVTNNHAFRMSLNSNVLDAKLHLPVAKRAELLGHSVETNLKYYTYASKDDLDDLVELFDQEGLKGAEKLEVSPRSHPKVVNFRNKKSPETACFLTF